MKQGDIKEFELGNHCYGDILNVNGTDYDDLKKEDVIEFITDMLLNDINSESIMKEALKVCLENLQFDCTENDHGSCEQCGSYNQYNKYERG